MAYGTEWWLKKNSFAVWADAASGPLCAEVGLGVTCSLDSGSLLGRGEEGIVLIAPRIEYSLSRVGLLMVTLRGGCYAGLAPPHPIFCTKKKEK